MSFDANHIIALIIATSFAAGLNVYATVATLGLLGHFGALQLPSPLHLLQTWPVIIIAVVLFLLEMFADKIPYFDLVWNAAHTFIRVPVAALVAYGASHQLSPEWQMVSVAAATGISLVSHAGKTAIRAGVTPSPEPVSNTVISASEDAFAVGLTWFATHHPYIAAAIALVLVVVLILLIRWIILRLRGAINRILEGPRTTPQSPTGITS